MPRYSEKHTDHPLKKFFIQRGIKQTVIAQNIGEKTRWLNQKLNGYGKPLTQEQEEKLQRYADKVKDVPLVKEYTRHPLHEVVKRNNIDIIDIAEFLDFSISYIKTILLGYVYAPRTTEIALYLYVMSIDKSIEFPFGELKGKVNIK